MSGDLMGMKENFTSMVQRVQPWILSHFMMWLDLKVAEYKVHGCMILDQTGISSPRWLSDNICSQTTRIPKLTHVSNENKDEDNAFQALNQSAMFPGETSSKPHNNQSQINFMPNPITNSFNRKTSSLASCLSSEIQIQEFPSSSPSVSSSLLNLPKRQDSYRNENEIAPNMTIPLHHAMPVEENSQRTIDRIEIHSSDNLNSSSVNGFQKANMEKDCMNLEEEMNLNYDVEIKAEPFSSFSEEEVNLQSNCAPQYDMLGSVGKMNQNDVNPSISCESSITQSKGTITIDLNGKILEEDPDSIMMTQKPQLEEQQQQPHQMQQQQLSSALPPVESLTGRMFLHQIPVINLQNCNVRKVTSTTGRNKKSVPAVLSSTKFSNNSNSNARGKLICQTCGKIFRCRSSLSRHKWLHREKRHRCFVCKKAFHRKEHLYLHLKRHAKSNDITCPICAMKGSNLHAIEEHIRQCHQNIF